MYMYAKRCRCVQLCARCIMMPQVLASACLVATLMYFEEGSTGITLDHPYAVASSSLQDFSQRCFLDTKSTVSALGAATTPASVEYLVAVLSARTNFQRRQQIRQAWSFDLAREGRRRGLPSQVVFVVGNRGNSSEPDDVDRMMMSEHTLHGDLFVVPSIDTYQDSATKMADFYRQLFATKLQYRAIVKMDDDSEWGVSL